jgi:hypothetical protein
VIDNRIYPYASLDVSGDRGADGVRNEQLA